MSNVSLQSLVDTVVNDFIDVGELFTALDVSNKVKEQMPSARHREVRDVVRAAWTSSIEPKGYGRSPITVNLSDGSTAQALLYHPLADSWDLDSKYDVQQRAKTSARPQVAAPVAVTVGDSSVSVSDSGTIVSQPAVVPTPVVTPTPAATTASEAWKNLFNTQPSLFPLR
ncbi:MAG: hypothetical protein WCT07_04175 [Candidatus Paceibacterota bacterium]